MSGGLGRCGAIVAARTGSTRLPGKALLPLGGKPMILFLLDRLRNTMKADLLLLATTTLEEDDQLAELVIDAGYCVFRGASEDVVARFVDAAEEHDLDTVVRITGDCPFVNYELLDYCIDAVNSQSPFHIASTKGCFPVGIDLEIYNADEMRKLHANVLLDAEYREHLTLYMYHHPERFKILQIQPPTMWQIDETFTVDTEQDFQRIQAMVRDLGTPDFSLTELANT